MEELTLTELKARAYDIISHLEAGQQELQAVNAEIGARMQKANSLDNNVTKE